MADPLPPSGPPVTSVEEAIARMQAIEQSLPATDGLACFNRMYLEVTQDVNSRIAKGFFSDGHFMSTLDTAFANMYFDAVDALADPSKPIPKAWQPLVQSRSQSDIY